MLLVDNLSLADFKVRAGYAGQTYRQILYSSTRNKREAHVLRSRVGQILLISIQGWGYTRSICEDPGVWLLNYDSDTKSKKGENGLAEQIYKEGKTVPFLICHNACS